MFVLLKNIFDYLNKFLVDFKYKSFFSGKVLPGVAALTDA